VIHHLVCDRSYRSARGGPRDACVPFILPADCGDLPGTPEISEPIPCMGM